MPCSYEFDSARRLMILRASGKLTPEELVDTRARGAADPRFDRTWSSLADFRAVTAFERRPRVILEMARNPIVARNTRIAILPPEGEQWGMARLFVACAQLLGRPVEVFHDLEKAERWLGVWTG
ncbi:MAG TPA: hypothetical protein VF159_00210 [Gemmatimonadaceae bacterium]